MADAPKSDVWMAFYVGTYLANTLNLSRERHGSYLMLILAAFKNGGWLPNDDVELAIIARCTPKEWKAERRVYEAFFEVTEDRWVHTFVEGQLERAARLTQAKSAAGKKGAENRWQKDSRPMAGPSPSQRQTDAQSESHPHNSCSHGKTIDDAARASASPDGPPRPRLPESAKWAERLDSYRPWLPHTDPLRGRWHSSWGLPPDSAGNNPLIPTDLLAAWRAKFDAEMEKLRSAA
ncbi:YdaU family protein [Reyranella sp.]|uniref:YdaU family protein n=1 Tax=Reyranella sp. TaxID=1929291 RepID=UPI004037406E